MDAFFRIHAGLFFVYWMTILGLVAAMVIVALSDAMTTIAYARLSQSQLRRQRSELEAEIRRYRESQNGKPPSEG